MKFKAKKQYGKSKEVSCPFCSRTATQKNQQGLDVCYQHVTCQIEEIKCTCGSWLEQKVGKFGPYFNCINCGNFNFQKGLEIKALTMKIIKVKPIKDNRNDRLEPKKEITITSNDVEYFD
ncbi:MAG TPA: hypothetical protein VJI98_04985 [Candidatus Nanoarchaeia archaeon]|nr:hypothetical protein [Candidatus Nanoarchaeia archaeon]